MVIFVGSWAIFHIICIFILYTTEFTIEIGVSKKLPEHFKLLEVLKREEIFNFLPQETSSKI